MSVYCYLRNKLHNIRRARPPPQLHSARPREWNAVTGGRRVLVGMVCLSLTLLSSLFLLHHSQQKESIYPEFLSGPREGPTNIKCRSAEPLDMA